MTYSQFLAAVARRTGESIAVIRARGFHPWPPPMPEPRHHRGWQPLPGLPAGWLAPVSEHSVGAGRGRRAGRYVGQGRRNHIPLVPRRCRSAPRRRQASPLFRNSPDEASPRWGFDGDAYQGPLRQPDSFQWPKYGRVDGDGCTKSPTAEWPSFNGRSMAGSMVTVARSPQPPNGQVSMAEVWPGRW